MATIVLESRVDARIFAGLLRYMEEKGYRPQSRCEAASAIIESMADVLRQAGTEIIEPDTDEQAMDFISKYFGVSLLKRKNARRVFANEQMGVARAETGIMISRPASKGSMSTAGKLEDDMASWTPEQKHEFLRKAIEAANATTGAREQYVSDESKPIGQSEFEARERAEIDRQKAFFTDMK